jgi:hypothetical protein
LRSWPVAAHRSWGAGIAAKAARPLAHIPKRHRRAAWVLRDHSIIDRGIALALSYQPIIVLRILLIGFGRD